MAMNRWNKGGKLPGLRGGPETHGCSGGNATDGTSCFSTRLMWRTSGSGEGMSFCCVSSHNRTGIDYVTQFTHTFLQLKRVSAVKMT